MKRKKKFSYSNEDETIKNFIKLSTEEKLNWLEEINEFTNLVLNDKEKEIREKLRSCKI